MKTRFSTLEETVATGLEKCEEAINVSLHILGTLHKKYGSNYINLQLAALSQTFPESFYNHSYGMRFRVTVMKGIKTAMEEIRRWGD